MPMTPMNLRSHQWLMLMIPFLMTGCNTNPSVFLSTGTTVGLEATPPVNETPPTITFGYKRMELAMVPVPELPSKERKSTSNSNRGCQVLAHGKPPISSAQMKKAEEIKNNSGSNNAKEDKDTRKDSATADQPPPSEDNGGGNERKTTDAYSVLAVFHLAMNWFGPAKIEQYFATGCAATHLVSGLTEAEEDQRGAEEAGMEALDAKKQVAAAGTAIEELQAEAHGLETSAAKTKALSVDTSKETSMEADGKPTKNEKQKAAEADRTAKEIKEIMDKIKGLQAKADKYSNSLEEAGEKAKSAIRNANHAMRSEEAKEKAQKAKEGAQKVLEGIEAVKQKVTDAASKLERARANAEEAKKTASDIAAPKMQEPLNK
jgi:hypothetical protein